MLGVVLLLQLTLWVATIHAFFPWNACEVDNTCSGKSRRTVDGQSQVQPPPRRDAVPSKVVSFELHQRSQDASEDVAQRTARALRTATRFAQRHAPLEALRGSIHYPELVGRTNKYTVVTPLAPTTSKSAGIFQDGSDFSYFLEAKFGAAEKPMYMLVDSGAATTWVMGSTCKSTACSMHSTFGLDDSKSLKLDTKPFAISYGSGNVKGQLARDTVSVAGMAVDMKFGVANDTSDDFTHFPFDGILGLSMGNGITDNFMGTLLDQKLVDSRVFSVNLGRGADGINNGQITFGGVDSTKYTGAISYTATSAKANGDWAIPLDDVGVDGKSSGITGRIAYIDTGTSFAFGSEADAAAFHKLIPGASSTDKVSYTVPCSTNVDITVTFSGVTYNISPKDWITKRDDVCTSNIFGYEVVKNAWLLGDIFLKNVYTVFDGAEKRIGFAKKAALPDVPKSTIINNPASATIGPSGPNPSTKPVSPGSEVSSSPPGQQSGGAAAATGPSATPAQVALADQLGRSVYVSVMCVVAVMVMVA